MDTWKRKLDELSHCHKDALYLAEELGGLLADLSQERNCAIHMLADLLHKDPQEVLDIVRTAMIVAAK